MAAALCGVSAYFANAFLEDVISWKIAVIVAMLVAVLVYIVMLIVLKAFTEEDILAFPKGEKLVSLLKKAKILR